MRQNKTTWQEIKERVEIKIGEEIDNQDFAVLANSAISDLNEVAYIDSPPMRYGRNKIKTEDDSELIDINKDLLAINSVNGVTKVDDLTYEVELPFEYNVGYGEINFDTIDLNDESRNNFSDCLEDLDNVDGFSNKIIIKFKNVLTSTMQGNIKITKRSLRLKDVKNNLIKNEMWVQVPPELSSIIKVEIIDSKGNISTVTESSLGAINENSYGQSVKYEESYYYIHDNKIHVFTNIKDVFEINVYFARRMRKVKKNIDLGTQYVELETNFENLLTLSITHIWLENFVGSEDSETRSVFQKYLLLKKEYEQTNLPKRVNRKQTEIIMVV